MQVGFDDEVVFLDAGISLFSSSSANRVIFDLVCFPSFLPLMFALSSRQICHAKKQVQNLFEI